MKSVLRKSFVYALAKVLPAASTLFVVAFQYKLIGAEEYGKYAIVSVVALGVGSLSSSWLAQSIVRFRPERGTLYEVSIRLRKYLGAIAATTVLLLNALTLPFVPFEAPLLLAANLVGLSTLGFTLLSYWHQAHNTSAQVARMEISRAATILALTLGYAAVIAPTADATLVVGILAAATAVGAAVGLPFAYQQLITIASTSSAAPDLAPVPPPRWGESLPITLPSFSAITVKLLRYGLPLALWGVVAMVMNYCDRVIVEHYQGLAEAGTYSLLYDLTFKSITFACAPILLAVTPEIYAGGELTLRDSNRRLTPFGIGLLSVIAIGTLFLAVYFLAAKFMWEMAYQQAMTRLEFWVGALVLLAGAVWGLSQILQKRLELRLNTSKMTGYASLAAGANLLLNLLIIPQYGVIGAAATTLLSSVLYVVLIIQTK